jgi:hypothetical protein
VESSAADDELEACIRRGMISLQLPALDADAVIRVPFVLQQPTLY